MEDKHKNSNAHLMEEVAQLKQHLQETNNMLVALQNQVQAQLMVLQVRMDQVENFLASSLSTGVTGGAAVAANNNHNNMMFYGGSPAAPVPANSPVVGPSANSNNNNNNNNGNANNMFGWPQPNDKNNANTNTNNNNNNNNNNSTSNSSNAGRGGTNAHGINTATVSSSSPTTSNAPLASFPTAASASNNNNTNAANAAAPGLEELLLQMQLQSGLSPQQLQQQQQALLLALQQQQQQQMMLSLFAGGSPTISPGTASNMLYPAGPDGGNAAAAAMYAAFNNNSNNNNNNNNQQQQQQRVGGVPGMAGSPTGGSSGSPMPSSAAAAAAVAAATAGGAAAVDAASAAAGANNTAVSSITLDPTRSNNEILERVCALSWLKELCLKGCKNISVLAPIGRLRNLWRLNLQGCLQYVDDNLVRLIGSSNRRLSRLNLCGCERITDATPLAQLTFLFDLNLSGCQIDNHSLEAISNSCTQLSRLAINSCPNITSVASVGHLKELKLLYCRYSGNIDPASITEMLGAIGGGLLTLNIDGVRFPRLELGALPPVAALKNLNCKDNIEMESLTWLTGLPGVAKIFVALETVDLEGCSALTTLGEVAALPALKTLRLSHTAITQSQLEAVAESRSLTTLYLDGCHEVHSVECLAQLRNLHKLTLDPSLQGRENIGLQALMQSQNHIDVTFPAPSTANSAGGNSGGGGNNNNNNNNNNKGGHGHSHYSPFSTPTTHKIPPLPTH